MLLGKIIQYRRITPSPTALYLKFVLIAYARSSNFTYNFFNFRTASSSTQHVEGDQSDLLLEFNGKPLFDGTFFIAEKIEETVIIAKCAICLPHITFIRGPIKSTSNFIKHLRKKHNGSIENYNKYKSTFTTTSQHSQPSATKTLVQSKFSTHSFSKKESQVQFDLKLIKFVAEIMSPISIIEHESFKNLFTDNNVNIMTRKTFVKKVKLLHEKKVTEIKIELRKCEFVCTTADIWSARKRSFLGITCHWINPETFQRKSVALACERFSGAHTFDRIAEKLNDVFTKFDLDVCKNVATVTDNGSNFVKSFKEFGINTSTFENEDSGEGADDPEEEDIAFVPLEENTNINNSGNGNGDINLPRHVRCSSHTLNLLATTDVNAALNTSLSMRSRHTNILAKCSNLWKLASKPKSAEILKKVLGHSLSYPTVTRWNSFYDSVSQILSISKENMNKLTEELQLKEPLKDADKAYLQEYCKILKPVAETVDFLQGENNTYFGFIIPSITSLRLKLQKIKVNVTLSRSGTCIVDYLILRLRQRFSQYFDFSKTESKEAIMAAVTCPNIKFRWLTESISSEFNINLEDIKQTIIHAGVEMEQKNMESDDSPEHADCTENISFFEFESERDTEKGITDARDSSEKTIRKVQLQLLQYIEDKRTNLHMLNDYPAIKRVFLKYNTILPSSAPVERLFSFAGMINTPKRQQLGDDLFEIFVLHKANGVKALI